MGPGGGVGDVIDGRVMCLGLTDRRDQRRLGIYHVLYLDSDADCRRRSRGGGKTLRLLIREVYDMRRSEWTSQHQSKANTQPEHVQSSGRTVRQRRQALSTTELAPKAWWCERDTDRQQLP